MSTSIPWRSAARLQIAAGQTWLSRGAFSEGVEDHAKAADLARTFDQDDLFGYREQIGLATSSYGEILVQEERNPKALLPWPVWEVAPGITATMGLNGFPVTPGPSGEAYGVGTLGFGQASFAPAIRVRHWLTPRNAVGGELRVASLAGMQGLWIASEGYGISASSETPGGDYPEMDIEELFSASMDWSHTRTGGTLLDSGLTLRLVELSTDNIRDTDASTLEQETYEELLGGPTAFVAIPRVRTGFGLRFGRGELPPWEFALHYRLERAAFPNGVLADQGPYYLNRFDASIRRSVFIGSHGDDGDDGDDNAGAEDTAATNQPTTSLDEGRARAEERWGARPLGGEPGDGVGLAGWGYLGAAGVRLARSIGAVVRAAADSCPWRDRCRLMWGASWSTDGLICP